MKSKRVTLDFSALVKSSTPSRTVAAFRKSGSLLHSTPARCVRHVKGMLLGGPLLRTHRPQCQPLLTLSNLHLEPPFLTAKPAVGPTRSTHDAGQAYVGYKRDQDSQDVSQTSMISSASSSACVAPPRRRRFCSRRTRLAGRSLPALMVCAVAAQPPQLWFHSFDPLGPTSQK